MAGTDLSELKAEDVAAAARLLGRAYRDNPLNVALLGDDPEVRTRAGVKIQAARIAAMEGAVVARRDGEIVGVYGVEPPGGLVMSAEGRRQMASAFAEAGPGVMALAGEMLAGFAQHSPRGQHWKLGPVAVEPALQGSGIGKRMVEHFCARMDARQLEATLDTDRPENVRLYERYGFEVVTEAPVLGVQMWFMRRAPGKGS